MSSVLKQLAKKLMFGLAPRWSTSYYSARVRAHSHKVVAEWGCPQIAQQLAARYGTAVLDGPFAGLRLTPMSFAEHISPYLLGVYESELDTAWERVFGRSYSQIFDIGAKFGYYAVGLARRFPGVSVVGFDTDSWARKAMHEMMAANGVRIDVLGFCDPEWLRKNLRPDAFIISDCEGYEQELFGSGSIAHLSSATLIIETHDDAFPGCCARVRRNLEPTHEITEIKSHQSRRASTVDLTFLTDRERELALNEVRPEQVWLLCVPRSNREAANAATPQNK